MITETLKEELHSSGVDLEDGLVLEAPQGDKSKSWSRDKKFRTFHPFASMITDQSILHL